MKHDEAIKAMDNSLRVCCDDDAGLIVALGKYDTANCHDYERRHPLNKRNWALVSWESGVRTWTRLSDIFKAE